MECFRYCLLLFTVSQVVAGNSDCSYLSGFFSDHSYDSYLYLKYEEALIKDHSQLEELRTTFISVPLHYLHLPVYMSAVNLINTTGCDNDTWFYSPTFCPTSQHTWSLCKHCPLQVTLEYTTKCSMYEELPFYAIVYASLMHATFTSFYWPLNIRILTERDLEYFDYFYSCYEKVQDKEIELNLDDLSLRCNPSCSLTQQVLSDMLSWVSQE